MSKTNGTRGAPRRDIEAVRPLVEGRTTIDLDEVAEETGLTPAEAHEAILAIMEEEDTDEHGEQDAWFSGRPVRYPYQDVADAFLGAANERDLGLEEHLRALADLFEVITFDPIYDEGRLESRREAWLAFGYIIEVTEGGVEGIPGILTDEEREEAAALVSTTPTIAVREGAGR